MSAESHGPFGCVVLAPRENKPAKPRHATRDDQFAELLADWLTGLVPLFIAELQDASEEEIERLRIEALEQIASHGDDLQYGGKHQASSRTALAKAFAILARAEGGVTAMGVHACTAPHIGCPGHSPTPTSTHPSADSSEPTS